MRLAFFIGGGAVLLGVLIVILWRIRRRVKLEGLSVEDAWLKSEFERCNVIVAGKKGSGKDVLFAHVIALRNEPHYANIIYDGETRLIELKDLELGENTFQTCVEGKIIPIEATFDEQIDTYISDGGIFLPCQYNEFLNKLYPSMPIRFALNRHLYDANIHVNVQNFGRLWDKLREQADSYIKVLRTVARGDHLIVTAISYDNYESAVAGFLPSKHPADIMAHGEIRKHTFRVPIVELQYDSRYFRKVFLKVQSNQWEDIINHVRR